MELEISCENGVVKSAWKKDSFKCFHLIINTEDRWVFPDATETGLDYKMWVYYPSAEDAFDYVKLVATTTSDKQVLDRMEFRQHNKDQLWVILPSDEVLNI